MWDMFLNWLIRVSGMRGHFWGQEFDSLLKEVVDICIATDRKYANSDNVGGEYKRAEVFGKMVKRHPEVGKKDIALAIELAVRRL
jgi:hypothetical protein